jgi:molecular chaperone GrpE
MDGIQTAGSQTPENNELEELKKQVDDLTNSWKRAVADYKNLEKRVEREREDFARFSNLLLTTRLLSVLDNLLLASQHVKDQGLDIVVSELKNIISEQGVREMEVKVEDDFDPSFHECVELVSGPGDKKVVEVVAPGYIMGERVIRPAKVKVSKI